MAGVNPPVLFGKVFTDLYKESLDRIKVNAPDYTALLSSDPGIAVLDAFLYQTALLGEKTNLLPLASLVAWVNYLGIEKKGPSAAEGTLTVILEEALEEDYVIPLGSRFLDEKGLTFLSTAEAIIPEGQTEIDIPVETEQKGSVGNVSANSIIFAYSTLPFVKEIFNPQPLTGGFDTELDDEALDRGRKILKHLWRAVTIEDYEELARAVSGIEKGKAIDTPGSIKLYLLSEDGQPANDELIKQVIEFLQDKRLQAVALQVLPAELKEIAIIANIKLQAGFNLQTVTALATAKLSKILDPRLWTWGRKISISELFAGLEEVQGVDFVDELLLPVENIHLEAYELAKLGGLTLNAI